MTRLDPTAPFVAVYVRAAHADSATRMHARAAALKASAEQSGWTVSAVLTETRPWGISDQMLVALTAYDVVLVDGLSQLTRDASRGVVILEHLEAAAVQVVVGTDTEAVAMNGEDASVAVRALMAVLGDAVRSADREARSHRVKAGIAAVRARRGEQR